MGFVSGLYYITTGGNNYFSQTYKLKKKMYNSLSKVNWLIFVLYKQKVTF